MTVNRCTSLFIVSTTSKGSNFLTGNRPFCDVLATIRLTKCAFHKFKGLVAVNENMHCTLEMTDYQLNTLDFSGSFKYLQEKTFESQGRNRKSLTRRV